MKIKKIIIRIAIIILIVETLIMLLLDSISYELSALIETAIDSFLLVCMSTPIIYLWVIKPYKLEREHEQDYLFQKSRMAQMGEMISMIAHQWRQPLAAISVIAARTKLSLELEKYNLDNAEERTEFNKDILYDLDQINTYVQGLSSTINDFRDFYKPEKHATNSLLDEPIKKALSILRDMFIADKIEVIENYEAKDILSMYEREMMQVIINILTNSLDKFREKQTSEPMILISTSTNNKKTMLKICDNAGGVSKEVLPNIFDPYFSTKGEKNGTGLGLYMSKIIVETHHNGEIRAENKEKGVCFIIEIENESQKVK